ncbi:MAG: muramoyltetrapeptide carboxypeptidase [Thermoanaerobaculia bacterium]|jgi:muramoyltetrapeptide carboxypeptidase|nr:muramoyltetrapeptide carboxypeptidase [Thermoanaerobaculia bacterium]
MLTRRDFAKLTVTAAAITATKSANAAITPTIKPKKLSPGDTVGLVLPATAAFESDEIQFAKEQMEAIGFKVVIGKHAFDKWGYFAGHDRDRADDINQMFADDQVSAVVCYTGGWGSPRVLPYLDYDLIRRKPKVLIGYSDITALLNAVHKKTGLITFHGPVGGSTFDPFTLDNFRKAVMSSDPIGLLPIPSKKPNELVDRTNRIIKIAPGKATGPLIGGNLTMIATLMGTPYQPDTSGAIVFLEDVHEEPYRIDRMLTTLSLGGMFDKCAGVIFGRCSDCAPKGQSFSLEEILRDRFGSLPIPSISGLSFGHIEQKLVLPIGARATLDADAGTVRVEEGGVG